MFLFFCLFFFQINYKRSQQLSLCVVGPGPFFPEYFEEFLSDLDAFRL